MVEVLRSDWLTQGPVVPQFEDAIAAFCGADYAVAFSSGTAALHAACIAAGLNTGDEAITTPLTFVATANAVLYCGAHPVFADVEADTLTLDPDHVERCFTPRTKAVLPVDYAGHPADLDRISALAHAHGCIVIEDAAHAFGAEFRGRRVGGMADLTVFSFHPVKHFTTGEGGAVTTQDPDLAHRLRLVRNHGMDRDMRERHRAGQWEYDVIALGYNYRLTDIGAALGLSQLQRIESNVRRRREIAARYTEAFRTLPGVVTPGVRPDVMPAWHLYPIRLDQSALAVDRGEVFRALHAENIGVNVHYVPVHRHQLYRERFGTQSLSVAEDAYKRLISLPMFHSMTDSDVNDVIEAVEKVTRCFAIDHMRKLAPERREQP